MRDIKFRAWNGESMEYGGFFVHATGSIDEVYILSKVDEDSPLMQFAGLKDKNAKDIYEGDVVYLAGYGNYECEFPFLELYEAMEHEDIGAILGNIHQNPELLKA